MEVLRLIALVVVVLVGAWFLNHNLLGLELAIENWGK